jgi:hypothetical protein
MIKVKQNKVKNNRVKIKAFTSQVASKQGMRCNPPNCGTECKIKANKSMLPANKSYQNLKQFL